MSGWQNAISALCIVSVIGAVVQLLLPSNSLGKNMKTVINLVIVASLIGSIMSLVGETPKVPEFSGNYDSQQAESYLTNRVVSSLTEETERTVLDTLQQFGIKNGQISIEFNKGKYGNVTLKHISVYIPKEHAADTQMIKNLLLKRFDVFCDVAVAEDEDEEAE